jgi:hypothetical protein
MSSNHYTVKVGFELEVDPGTAAPNSQDITEALASILPKGTFLARMPPP